MVKNKHTKAIILFLIFIFSSSAFAESPSKSNIESDSIPKIWTFGGLFSLGFSQMSFTNWSAGGDNSYSLNGLANLSYNYLKEKKRWDNNLSLSYGFLHQSNFGYKKTDDKIEFYSKYSYEAKRKWFYSSILSFKSQFAPGYDYTDDVKNQLISQFLAPGYLQAGVGMEYRPNEELSILISPTSYKLTLVYNDSILAHESFGVDPGKHAKNEFGASIFGKYAKDDVVKNIGINTSLGLFSNYFHNPLNIDVDWQLLITMKINNFLSTDLSTQLIYDNDTKTINNDGTEGGASVQFKEIFRVGLHYKF